MRDFRVCGLLAAFVAAFFVAGCADRQPRQVHWFGTDVRGDIANAADLAERAGDDTGALCWIKLYQGVAAETQVPAEDGAAVVIERDRLARQALAGECGAVFAPILVSILKLFPKLSPVLAGLP